MLEVVLAENRALKVREAAMQQRLLLQRQAEDAGGDALRAREAALDLREETLRQRESAADARERDLEARLLALEEREAARRGQEAAALESPRADAAGAKAPRRRTGPVPHRASAQLPLFDAAAPRSDSAPE